jgi:hypothetical protein
VSPLRRTIWTAYGAFKDTKNFKKIKFILHPDIREFLGDTDDTPVDIRTIIKMYAPLFPKGLDYSLFEDLVYPELWFVNNLALKASRDLVYEAIAESAGLIYKADLEVFFNEEG